MEAALAAQLFVQLTLTFARYIFFIRARDMTLPIYDVVIGPHLALHYLCSMEAALAAQLFIQLTLTFCKVLLD